MTRNSVITSSSSSSKSSSKSSSTSTSTTSKHTLSGVRSDGEIMNGLMQELCAAISPNVPQIVINTIVKMTGSGYAMEVIQYAVEETVIAPYPSWRYLLSILNRLRRNQSKTLAQASERPAAAAGARQMANPALDYQQRPVSEMQLDGYFLRLD